MKRILIQIYEIQNPKEAEQLVHLGIDHIGTVILDKDSWKIADIRDVVQVVDQGGAKCSIIPLFSDPDLILKLLDYYEPHLVHFCESLVETMSKGNNRVRFKELEFYIRIQEQVKNIFPNIQIIRSIPIGPPGNSHQVASLELAKIFEPFTDYFLTDTLLFQNDTPNPNHQPVAGFIGITGKTCDWDIAQRLVSESRIPVILAGGITPENVREGILKVKPAGVDSCTGTNELDSNGQVIRFKKDMAKVKKLIQQVREAEQLM